MRTRAPGSIAAALLALALGGVLLAACGETEDTAATDGASEEAEASAQASPSPDPEESPDSEGAAASAPEPQCVEIWVDDATLPGGYASCYDEQQEIEPERRRCSSGQLLLVHDERFWAVRGGTIAQTRGDAVADDPRYRDVLATCSA